MLIGGAFAAPVFLMSYSPEQPDVAQVSAEAPEIALSAGDSTISLKSLRGKRVVLHFWSKSDPSSRIANRINDRKVSTEPGTVYLAVCTDDDESLARLISNEDNNQPSSQFYRSQIKASSHMEAYTVAGNHTWVISPEGVILSRS